MSQRHAFVIDALQIMPYHMPNYSPKHVSTSKPDITTLGVRLRRAQREEPGNTPRYLVSDIKNDKYDYKGIAIFSTQ